MIGGKKERPRADYSIYQPSSQHDWLRTLSRARHYMTCISPQFKKHSSRSEAKQSARGEYTACPFLPA